jgi:hypothetical protein
MPGREVTRRDLRRALAVNAATKPVNVLVPAGMVVVAVVLGTWWLVLIAVVVYAVLCAQTFFDGDEAQRVGERVYARAGLPGVKHVDPRKLAPPIGAQLAAALQEQQRIRGAITAAELPFDDLGAEVVALVGEMERTASRAQLVHDYVSGIDARRVEARLQQLRAAAGPGPDDPARKTADALEEQLAAHRDMRRQLNRYYAEMEQTVAALSTIHAQVVRMGVTTDAAGDAELAGSVRELRGKVNALTEGISEAYAEAPDTPG